MNKQVHCNVDSGSDLQENGGSFHLQTKSDLSSFPRKYKALALVATVLFVATMVAAVAALVVSLRASQQVQHATHSLQHTEQRNDPYINMETREQLLRQVADSSRASVRQARMASDTTSSGKPAKTSCYSIKTNKTHPAAHIAGKGFRWTSSNDPTSTSIGYQPSWICGNQSDAYVDGGMFFNQKDQKLYVPTCGYYYVSSNIFFQSDSSVSTSDVKYVRHQLYIDRNCSYADDIHIIRSYSSFTASPQLVGRTSTYTGDVVKMCAGGSIFVYIPEDQYNPCCPYGRSQTTYMSAFLVSETGCEAPRVLNRPPTEEDIANANM